MANKKQQGADEKLPLTQEQEEQVIIKYFGCPSKYIRKRGTHVSIDVTGMAYDGYQYKTGKLG